MSEPIVKISVVPEGYLIHIENGKWLTRIVVGPKTFGRLCDAGLQLLAPRPETPESIPLSIVEWPAPDLSKQNTA